MNMLHAGIAVSILAQQLAIRHLICMEIELGSTCNGGDQ